MSRGRNWTAEDLAMLRQLAADGADMNTAIRALSRTAKAIHNKARRLGIPHDTMMKGYCDWFWSEEQIAVLVRLWRTGQPASEIGRRLGRSAGSVKMRASEIGLPRRRAGTGGGRPPKIVCAEQPKQSAAWQGARFTDSPAAMRAEPMLRGLPPVNISAMTTCAAAAAE